MSFRNLKSELRKSDCKAGVYPKSQKCLHPTLYKVCAVKFSESSAGICSTDGFILRSL